MFVYFVVTSFVAMIVFNVGLFYAAYTSGNSFWATFLTVYVNAPTIEWLILLCFSVVLFRFAWIPLLLCTPGVLHMLSGIITGGFSFGNWGVLTTVNTYVQIGSLCVFILGYIYFGIILIRKLSNSTEPHPGT